MTPPELAADLSAALEVEILADRLRTSEELHVRIRPAESPPAEGAIWEAEGPDQHLEYDWFQRAAFACVERGESVLVAAPTSAGKTAVARKAIHQCIASGTRCVYTAPIKALSNEKFSEFVQEFSPDRVALLTGDARAGNPETAHVVVMTTEVLVSLLHSARLEDPDPGPEGGEARPPGLIRSLSCAVFDEIHYIADEERGTAWEEAIVLLERHVQLVGLSATVPNFCELAGWVAQTRHLPCHGIYSRRRPVPLVHGVVCCPFDGSSPVEVTKRGRFMQRAYEAAVQRLPEVRTPVEVSRADRGRDLVALVQACRNGQLPLIVFSFSRRESAEMARQLAPAVRLKPGARRLIDDTVREVIQKHLQEPDRQLQSVRECHFLLSRGVGVHHGGLLPVLREITEKLFKDGLVRVLCTTETFAVGVNMPSRSVVFNWPADHEFQKYDGMEQRNILVAEYMQMAGRAGRRNQDKRGNAWNVITRRHPSQRLRALMIGGNIERVESKFRLSWPLMLRCLRSGGSGVLQLLLTQSFRQFLSKMANASVFESELEPKMQVLRAEGLAEGAGLKELGSAAAYIQVAHPALLCFRMLKTDFRALLRADALPTFVAFLSSFANDLEEEEEVATADRFGPYWQWCEDQVPQISETLRACGVMDEVSLGQLRRRAGFVQATYLWMQKENFERCSDAAGGAEYDGILARVLKRTSLLLKQLEMAMALLGLAEQEALLQQARGMLSRGGAAYQSLPFLDSIYLAIAFEPDTLDVSLLRRQQRPCPYPVGAKVELAPSEIGFSHFSISARFKPERGAPAMSIAETLQELLDGKDPESIPEMPVFWTDNQFWTLANRRLATFRLFQQRCGDAARSAKVKVRVAGPEEAEEWGFWWRWTTGLWRGRRAVLRNTSEMIGRTAEETTFRALSSSQDVGEVFAETGYERCPARPRDMCHEEADEMDDTENDTGGGAMGEEEALEMEDFSVALDQQQVSRFLINRELDCTDCAEKPRSSYSVSRPATSRDLIWSAGSDACELSVEDPIPEKFENIHQYLRSFALPMLEELREGLGAALDPAQLNLQQAEAARLHSFQAAKDSKMMGLPPKPAWFKVASSEILLVLTPTGQPCKAARWAPGQMCLLYEEGALQDALALGGGDESADRAPAVQAKPGGCCRFGMIHTTPKSKHALVLVSQRKDLPKVTEREERRVRYQNARDRRADVEVQKGPDGRSTAVRVQQDGAAWRQGLRVGMACKVRRKAKDEEGESDSEEEAQLQAPDAAASAVIFEGKLRLWRLAKLEANVMAQLRVAQAMADPEGHQPIFWQREISGQPDHAASAFGRMAEQKCQAMGEEEFTLEAALNESQEQAVRKLVRCSHGVQLVQGPPGTGKTHTLSVLLQQCALLALGSSSAPGTTPALGDVPSQPPEPRSASGDDGNERSQLKGAQQANRCLVCAPTNIAVQELLLRLLDRLEPSLRSQVALVATEERANVAWGEEVSPASSVLLDHRKKRVKRVARFWLGEGYDTRRQPKPFLRQVPWLWRCASPVAALLSEPGLAFGQCHAAGGSGTEVLCFVRQQLAELRAIILGQLDRLEQEVAFKAREFEPSFASKKETEERGAEGSIFSKLEALRNCLQHLAQLLQATLALWRVQRPPAGAAFASSEPPPSTGAGSAEPGAAAPEGGQYSFSMAERQRAYECVIWAAEDRKRLEELAELLSLEALPPGGRGQAAREAQEEATQKFAKAAKKLRVLVHPDKAHPEMKDMACLASQHIDPALAALRQHLKFREAKGQPTVPRAPQEPSFPAGKVVLHELLSCLDAATQKKLEEVLEVHQELQTACLMVRTCRSDKLKSALLRRCALIFCTLTVAGRRTVAVQQVPTLLLDEACQACEAETLTAMRHTVQRMFLVGDPRQLPATVASTAAKSAGYARSMFERLEQLGTETSLLEIQYRMEEPILRWSNESFYADRIQTSACVLRRKDVAPATVKAHPKLQHRLGPFRLFDTRHEGWKEEQVRFSFRNQGEADFVMRLIHDFIQHCDREVTIGIITPYRAQVELLKELLDTKAEPRVRNCTIVATVDGFQGNERDVIVISTVRSGGSIGFNGDERRLNVAVTRAKHRAWIVGDMETLYAAQSKGNVWRDLLAFAWARGWVLPALTEKPLAPPPRKLPRARPERWWSPLMRQEWEEQRPLGWMRSLERPDFGRHPYCSLCEKLAEDGHLESKQHRGNKRRERQVMTLTRPVKGFFVSLPNEPPGGFSLTSTRKGLRVAQIEANSGLSHWNEWVAEIFQVNCGSRVLEVEGLVGDQAAARVARPETDAEGSAAQLRMTVADDGDESESSEDVSGSDLPEPESEAAPGREASPWAGYAAAEGGERFPPPERHAPAPALGGPGFPWQALYDGTKARRCKGLDSEELCKFYHRGEVVVQLADWEELEDGMLRMPIRPPSTDAEAEAAWVTLDATRCGGRLVFKPLFSDTRGSLWRRCVEKKVVLRAEPGLGSKVLGDLQEQVVQQVGRCVPLDDGVVRMQLEHGWVTLDARPGGGPLFFHLLLLATDRARWRALAPAWLRKSCEVSSERCGKVSAGQILEQLGPWQRTGEEGLVRMPISRPGPEGGVAWVTLLKYPDLPSFELVEVF